MKNKENLLPISSYLSNNTCKIAQLRNKLRKIGKLTKNQEISLHKKFSEGCLVSRNKLISSNLLMVVNLSKKLHKNSNVSQLDLIQEGIIGLFDAINKFDPKKSKFSTLAYTYALGKIHNYNYQNGSIVSLPNTKEKKEIYYKINKFRNNLNNLDESLTEENILSITSIIKISKFDLNFIDQRVTKGDLSLNNIIDIETNETFQDQLEDTKYKNFSTYEDYVINDLDKLNSKINLKIIIKKVLDEREQEIIKSRFLKKKINLSAIGKKLNLSIERIRQIEKNSLIKLKKYITKNLNNKKLAS